MQLQVKLQEEVKLRYLGGKKLQTLVQRNMCRGYEETKKGSLIF